MPIIVKRKSARRLGLRRGWAAQSRGPPRTLARWGGRFAATRASRGY